MHSCLSCKSNDFYENKTFGTLPRVTSDSAPFPAGGRIGVCLQCGLVQKPVDERWKKEIGGIYGDYHMYELTGGLDQILFSAGGVTRAEKIVDILQAEFPTDFAGTVIDIGCGTGGFLKAFAEKFPHAHLYGKEINDNNLKYLERIPNFEKLYTAEHPTINQPFDLITSIHCFEHLYDYDGFFRELESIKKSDAKILLQVPDIDTSPFDIAIADHAAHFSQDTLRECLNRHVKNCVVFQCMDKELTAIARPNAGENIKPLENKKINPINLAKTLDKHVDYLAHLIEHIGAQRLSEFGVYGTTIAGAWLTGAFPDNIAFYVDDDPLKQGKKLYDKDIIAPRDVAKHGKVVMPFAAATRQKILQRHPNLIDSAVYCD